MQHGNKQLCKPGVNTLWCDSSKLCCEDSFLVAKDVILIFVFKLDLLD